MPARPEAGKGDALSIEDPSVGISHLEGRLTSRKQTLRRALNGIDHPYISTCDDHRVNDDLMLCCYRLHDSIRLLGDRFARCLLKSAHRYDVGVSSEAHSGDASPCECTYVCALADHDIDRQERRLR